MAIFKRLWARWSVVLKNAPPASWSSSGCSPGFGETGAPAESQNLLARTLDVTNLQGYSAAGPFPLPHEAIMLLEYTR